MVLRPSSPSPTRACPSAGREQAPSMRLVPFARSKHIIAETHQRFLGASQVLPLQPLGLGGIAPTHGGKYGLVLAQARLCPSRQYDDPADDDIGLLVDTVQHLGH